MVHRADRFLEIVNTCAEKNLALKRIRFIHPYLDRDANLLLIEAVKSRDQGKDSSSLVVYNSDGSYTEEIISIYSEE